MKTINGMEAGRRLAGVLDRVLGRAEAELGVSKLAIGSATVHHGVCVALADMGPAATVAWLRGIADEIEQAGGLPGEFPNPTNSN